MNNKQSPMLKFALETFQHGIEHYLEQSPLGRKFALMHIDQAVELLLKEKIVRLGKSIYKGDNTTLGMRECFASLGHANATVLERPRLEDLHDLRNAVQHKGLTPDRESTDYYVEVAYGFAKTFLPNELGIQFEEVVDRRHRALIEGAPKLDAAQVRGILQEAQVAGTPSERILTAYTAYRRAAELIAGPTENRIRLRSTIKNAALARGVAEHTIDAQLKELHRIRGELLDSDKTPTDEAANSYLELTVKIVTQAGLDI